MSFYFRARTVLHTDMYMHFWSPRLLHPPPLASILHVLSFLLLSAPLLSSRPHLPLFLLTTGSDHCTFSLAVLTSTLTWPFIRVIYGDGTPGSASRGVAPTRHHRRWHFPWTFAAQDQRERTEGWRRDDDRGMEGGREGKGKKSRADKKGLDFRCRYCRLREVYNFCQHLLAGE